jgi:2-keto-4-pentenoate hydratase/2-oxohepta-3-ene-1,7-dioic acid hydratase in catechol pathway
MRLVSFRRTGTQIDTGIASEIGIIDIHEGMALLSEERPLQPLGLHDILCGTHDVVHIGMVGALERMLLAQRAALEGAHWFGGVEMVMRRDDVQILAPLPKLGGWWRTAQHIEAHERMVYRRGEHLGLYWHERPPLWGALAHTWHGDRAVVPFPDTTACDIECELMWVLGRDVAHADSSAAQEAIVGMTLMASVVARDRADDDVLYGMWSRPVGAIMGPYLTTMDELDEHLLADGRLHISLQLIVNDVVRGQVNMRDVHYPMADVVAHASGSTTLVAGTVFSSGVVCSLSDYGGAWLVPGDEIAIDAGPLGTLRWSMEEWP